MVGSVRLNACGMVQVAEVAATTLQRAFGALAARAQLRRMRIGVLRVQRAALAMLLRVWERRFAQFVSAEQAQLIAGHEEVLARRRRVRGTLAQRRLLSDVRPPLTPLSHPSSPVATCPALSCGCMLLMRMRTVNAKGERKHAVAVCW
jgi:hypothetical protein